MLPSDSCEVGAQKDHMPQPRAPEAAKPKESETESSTCCQGEATLAALPLTSTSGSPCRAPSGRLASARLVSTATVANRR